MLRFKQCKVIFPQVHKCIDMACLSGTVNLNSLQNEGPFCPGDEVSFICHVDSGSVLQWAVEGVNSLEKDPLRFSVADPNPVVIENPYPSILNATLTATIISFNPFLLRLTSTLTVLVTTTSAGKRVYCSDEDLTTQTAPSITINTAGKSIFIYSYQVQSYCFLQERHHHL